MKLLNWLKSFFVPKHTAKSIAQELIKGLNDGTIVLSEKDKLK